MSNASGVRLQGHMHAPFLQEVVPAASAPLRLLSGALMALGVQAILTRAPIPAWQPIADGTVARGFAVSDGVVLLGLAAMVFSDVRRRVAAFGIAGLLLAWIVCLQAPGLLASAGSVAHWLAVAEVGAIASAGLLLGLGEQPGPTWVVRAATSGRIAFGLCALTFGLSHFVYARFSATLVPHWLPVPMAWVYLTGCAHGAAGLAIISGVLRRTAALFLAAMMATFVVLVHVPAVLANVGPLAELTFLFNATALCAAAWTIASTTPRRLARHLSEGTATDLDRSSSDLIARSPGTGRAK